MANVGAFCMAGVPILGLPNTITVRGRISSPNFDAAAAWSNSVKTTHPLAVTAASKRLIVSWTEYLLGLVIRPDSAGNDIFGTDTSKMARPRPKRPFRRVMEAPPIVDWTEGYMLSKGRLIRSLDPPAAAPNAGSSGLAPWRS